jgi:hypothetical protein
MSASVAVAACALAVCLVAILILRHDTHTVDVHAAVEAAHQQELTMPGYSCFPVVRPDYPPDYYVVACTEGERQ